MNNRNKPRVGDELFAPSGQVTAPRALPLRGEPHALAYINPQEAALLKSLGGSGAPVGPGGIPAFGFWSDTFGGGNSFSQSVANAFTPGDGKSYVGGQLKNDPVYQGPNIDGSAGYTVNSNGGAYTSGGNRISNGGKTITNSDGSTSTLGPGGQVTTTPPGGNAGGGGGGSTTPTGPTPEELAYKQAVKDRDKALKGKQAELSKAFGFFDDKYYKGLADNYKADSASAFETAYDDAMRGIYQGYKAAGILTQAGVDSDVGALNAAKGSETDRMGDLAQTYSDTNKARVEKANKDLGKELAGLVKETASIDEIKAQTAAINKWSVSDKVDTYKNPTDADIADFYTNFNKAADDPSYNVDPTYSSSTGKASNPQAAASNQPTSQVGVRSPYRGAATRTVG